MHTHMATWWYTYIPLHTPLHAYPLHIYTHTESMMLAL